MHFNFRDKNLISIWEKVQNNIELSLEDGMIVFQLSNLVRIEKMALWLLLLNHLNIVIFFRLMYI
ncbi:MAG: hypothetical protein N3A61_03060 [Ignavibacteria bacterium]|nr:hypothetical protein [Ignavibacteria bacterium]